MLDCERASPPSLPLVTHVAFAELCPCGASHIMLVEVHDLTAMLQKDHEHVGTTKKSTETRSKTWFWRNVRQVCEGGFGRRGMSRATVRCETSKPSLSSSPWMRGAPQRGFASAMVRTSFATSEPTDGRPIRPLRDFQVQNARKPCRCQRITVSGRTTWSASRHPAQRRESHTQKARSRPPNRGRFERWRSRA